MIKTETKEDRLPIYRNALFQYEKRSYGISITYAFKKATGIYYEWTELNVLFPEFRKYREGTTIGRAKSWSPKLVLGLCIKDCENT